MRSKTSNLLKGIQLPRFFRAKQIFPRPVILKDEIPDHIMGILSENKFAEQIKPGMRIAITAGSRGVDNVALITRSIVNFVKSRQAYPFIVPAMGSHGNATAEGQLEVLKSYGIVEEYVGCPIISSMEVKKIGKNEEGMDVLIDKNAAEADGIIVSCRIKPHTSFRGPFESGIMKMMAIGLGKQIGAQVCHKAGFKYMAKYVPMFGKTIIENSPIMFAVASIENAFDETCEIIAVNSDEIYEQEPILLKRAFANMPRIHVDYCDLLVVDQVGKYYSGDGMDPNVTGTFSTPYATGGIQKQHVVVLDVNDESHGNAMGIGHASATTRRAVEKLNLDSMYANGITCKLLNGCRIPAYVDCDKEAIQMGLALCVDYDENNPRIVRIANSLHLEHIMLSEAYFDEVKCNPNFVIESNPENLRFNENGNLNLDLD